MWSTLFWLTNKFHGKTPPLRYPSAAGLVQYLPRPLNPEGRPRPFGKLVSVPTTRPTRPPPSLSSRPYLPRFVRPPPPENGILLEASGSISRRSVEKRAPCGLQVPSSRSTYTATPHTKQPCSFFFTTHNIHIKTQNQPLLALTFFPRKLN